MKKTIFVVALLMLFIVTGCATDVENRFIAGKECLWCSSSVDFRQGRNLSLLDPLFNDLLHLCTPGMYVKLGMPAFHHFRISMTVETGHVLRVPSSFGFGHFEPKQPLFRAGVMSRVAPCAGTIFLAPLLIRHVCARLSGAKIVEGSNDLPLVSMTGDAEFLCRRSVFDEERRSPVLGLSAVGEVTGAADDNPYFAAFPGDVPQLQRVCRVGHVFRFYGFPDRMSSVLFDARHVCIPVAAQATSCPGVEIELPGSGSKGLEPEFLSLGVVHPMARHARAAQLDSLSMLGGERLTGEPEIVLGILNLLLLDVATAAKGMPLCAKEAVRRIPVRIQRLSLRPITGCIPMWVVAGRTGHLPSALYLPQRKGRIGKLRFDLHINGMGKLTDQFFPGPSLSLVTGNARSGRRIGAGRSLLGPSVRKVAGPA